MDNNIVDASTSGEYEANQAYMHEYIGLGNTEVTEELSLEQQDAVARWTELKEYYY